MSHLKPSRAGLRFLPLVAAMGWAVAGGAVWAQDNQGPGPVPAVAATNVSTASAEADDIKAPADPVAKAAFDALEKNCARCHQAGKHLTARGKPAKEFGFVLKLEKLAANPHYIKPGNPNASLIYKQIADGEMPYDIAYEGETEPEMTKEDIKAIEAWIVSLGGKTTDACKDRKFVSNKDLVSVIADDLEKLSEARAKGTRYLTLVHLANSCTDKKAMNVYRQGAVKLINSLSRSSDVVRLETIDPDKAIIRINIDDIGWEASDWDKVLETYPYALVPDSSLTAMLKNATGTEMPYVRADWFAASASRPPLYYTLLKLPKTFAELAKDQGVDIDANIKKFIAKRAGFQTSGVSRNNRLIERHPAKTGYFWTSYDFAGNRGNQSLFEFPLGPGGKDSFRHDGGETIFSLPNGFQAYYLNTAAGKRIDKGPTEIVQDRSRKDLAVTNGISCMGCHDQGMRKAKDEVRDHVLKGRVFSKDVRDAVAELHSSHETMDRIIDLDAKRFASAMVAAGLDPTLKYEGVEMINALVRSYDENIDLARAAAELGMTEKEFGTAAADATRRMKAHIRRLAQGVYPRDQFELVYRELAKDISDDKFLETAVADKAAADKKSDEKQKPKAKKQASLIDLALTSDKDSYEIGDTPTFTVVSPKDCFLTLTNVDENGEGTVLLPNKFQQNNRIKAGVAVTFPGLNAPFKYRMKDKGVETVVAVCSEYNDRARGIKHDFKRSAFTSVGNFSDSVARSVVARKRSIEVLAGDAEKASKARPVPSGKRFSGRTAVKIKVQ